MGWNMGEWKSRSWKVVVSAAVVALKSADDEWCSVSAKLSEEKSKKL